MSFMYVTEYAGLGQDPNGSVQAVAGPPLVEQPRVAITGASAPCLPFNPATTIVRLHVDVIASTNVGGAVATTNSGRMVAGQTEYFRVGVLPNGATMVANVIANT